jgi:hypothetical protein
MIRKGYSLLVALMLCLFFSGSAFGAAETLYTTQGLSGFPVYGQGTAGSIKVCYGTYEVAANVEDGDIFVMCKVPGGATIVGGMIFADDLDTNATETLDMDIGWAANGGSGTYDSADPDGLGNLGVWTGDTVADHAVEVGNVFHLTGNMADGDLPTFTKTTKIQIEANAAAATFAAGAVSAVVYYTMD